MNGMVSATGMGFTWDDGGNLLTWGDGADAWGYTYDPANRLINVEKNGAFSAHYTYDADGRRVRSVDDGGVTDYVYSGLNVIDEVSGGVHEKHYYAGGMHIASSSGGTLEYYHVDHLGSTRLKTDGAGDVVYVSNYEPYGPGCGEEGSEDYRYTGKREDPTGLYYFGARYYDPVTGRFITRDIMFGYLKNPQSQNRYVYCRNNPQKYIDPDGKDPSLYLFPLDAHNAGVYEAAQYGNLYPEDSEGQWNHYKNEAKADLYGSIAGYGAFAVTTIVTGGNVFAGACAYAVTKRYAKGWIKAEMDQRSYDIHEKGYTHLDERPEDYGLVDMVPDTILGGISAISPFKPTDPIGRSVNKYVGKINSDILDYLMNLERDYDHDSYGYDSYNDVPLD
ncbi:RHS repeat-associated core domain-containing protein [Candidatus Bathyarchaeota archaeon]|nr:RHS repeat-associated core domain-containing protein [Candidatus Bathyarchaeota archaeon]